MAAEEKSTDVIIKNYFQRTRSSGLTAAYYSESKIAKFAWLTIFIFLIVILLFNLFQLSVEFFSYPVYRVSKDVRPTEERFPSVTICSASDFSQSSVTMETLATVGAFVEQIENGSVKVSTFGQWRNKMESEHIESAHNKEFQHKYKSQFKSILLKNLPGSCTFSTVTNCNYSTDFIETFPSNEDKLCYTFNHNKNNPFFQRGNGPLFGLSIILFSNQSDYVPIMGGNNGVGLTVYIHPPNTYPFLGSHGISIPPGYLSYVAMHKIKTTRLPAPYPSNCSNGNNVFTLIPGDYTVMGCQISCQYYHMYRKCGHIEPFMRSFMPPQRYPRNTSVDVEKMLKCRQRMLNDLFSNGFKEQCDCPDPCHEEVYHRMVSMTRWPARVDIPIYRKVFAETLKIDSSLLTESYIRSNFLKLRVYFDELAYKHTYEQCKTSIPELFSNLGGQLGLWTGYSVFSIIEIVAVLFTIAYSRCRN
eukprot:gene10267-11322_t